MAWNDLANNQMVSYLDAETGGFTLRSEQTNPGTLQCMTKNQAFTMYYLSATSNTNSLSSNQLMQKSFWTGSVTQITLCYDGTSSTNACNQCASPTQITLCYDATSSNNACNQCTPPTVITLCYDGTSSINACNYCIGL